MRLLVLLRNWKLKLEEAEKIVKDAWAALMVNSNISSTTSDIAALMDKMVKANKESVDFVTLTPEDLLDKAEKEEKQVTNQWQS